MSAHRRRLLTTREAAEMLGVRPETVLRWNEAGKLNGFRISARALRFDLDELDAFLEGSRPAGRKAVAKADDGS